MGFTGGGASVSWTGSAGGAVITASRITRVGGSVRTGESVADDDLADPIAKQIAGDLKTFSPIEIEVPFDKSEFTTIPIYESGTLTVVSASGDQKVAGTAFVLSKSIGPLANNERIMMTYVFQPTAGWARTVYEV